MVARVVLGHLGGTEYGIKVSKPGIDVLVASDTQLQLSSTFKNFQFAYSGVLADPNAVGVELVVAFPSIGIKPRLWLASSGWRLEVKGGTLSPTGFTIKTTHDRRSAPLSAPVLSGDIYWAVMAQEYEF